MKHRFYKKIILYLSGAVAAGIIFISYSIYADSHPVLDSYDLTQGKSNFAVLDMTMYRNKPTDVVTKGFIPLNIIYEQEFYTDSKILPEFPPEKKIREKAKEAFEKSDLVNIDIEKWKLPNKNSKENNIDWYVRVAKQMKQEAPGLRLGFYVGPPLIEYWRAVGDENSEDYKDWQRDNDKVKPILDEVSVLFPNLYTHYPDRRGWIKQANAQIKEAKRLAGGRPIYPTIWMRYHPGSNGGLLENQYLPADYFRFQLETIYQLGADGVVIWGGWDFDNPKGGKLMWDENRVWWQETRQFLQKLEAKGVLNKMPYRYEKAEQ